MQRKKITLVLLALAPALSSQAQSSATASRSVVQQASPVYESALSDYVPYREPVLMSWRQANDQVRATGGMQGHDMSAMGLKSSFGSAGNAVAGASPAAGQGDPHARHNMGPSKITPGSGSGAPSAVPSQGHAEHSARPATSGDMPAVQAANPHAGHSMGAAEPAPASATEPLKNHMPAAANKNGVETPKLQANKAAAPSPSAPSADPHAGHDMSTVMGKAPTELVRKSPPAQANAAREHAGHSGGQKPTATDQTKKKKEHQ